MAPARKIPHQIWESHKAAICQLYLKEKKNLEEVMKIMETEYGFRATQAQYVGRLRRHWKMDKNSTQETWSSAASLIKKRKLDGKETDIFIDGEKVSEKKLKKALSRKYPSPKPATDALLSESPPSIGRGVTAHTPPALADTRIIEIRNLPWFQFQGVLDSSIVLSSPWVFGESPTNSTSTQDSFWSMESLAAGSRSGPRPIHLNPLYGVTELPTLPQNFQYLPPGSAGGNPVNQSSVIATSLARGSSGAQGILAKCLDIATSPDCSDYATKISSIIEEIVVESVEDDLAKKAQQISRTSRFDASYQLLRYVAYLSSNNLLSPEKTSNFLNWVIQASMLGAIEYLLKSKLPTMAAFGGNLLVAAADMEEIQCVRALLAAGADPNFLSGTEQKETALHKAARRRNAALVELLLSNGADLDIRQTGGRKDTALETSIRSIVSRRSDIPMMMLKWGADVNSQHPSDPGHGTLLALAVRYGSIELCQALLDAGAVIDPLNALSESALQVAVRAQDVELTEMLIAAGAHVDFPLGEYCKQACDEGIFWNLHTPLQIASSMGNMELIAVLLDAGAQVDGCPILKHLPLHTLNDVAFQELVDESSEVLEDIDRDSAFYEAARTPLQQAVYDGHAYVARVLLLMGADVNSARGYETALQIAVANEERVGPNEPDHHSMLRLLLRKGANINTIAPGLGSRTPLQAAAEKGDQVLVEKLLEAGANINAPPCPILGKTALQAAIGSENADLVKALLALGADIHAPAAAIGGLTCLQEAARSIRCEMFELLLRLKADVNEPPAREWGCTALGAATISGNDARVTALLDAGANINAHGLRCRSLLTTAIDYRRQDLLKLLLARGASLDAGSDSVTPLAAALEVNYPDMVNMLLHAGANVDEPSEGELPIEIAARKSSTAPIFLDILLRAGANVNGDRGAKAVVAAVNGEWRETLETLLAAGASPNRQQRDDDSDSALNLASEQGCVWAMELLLQAGADVNAPARGQRGKTALQAAVAAKQKESVMALLDAGADVNAPPSPSSGATALQAAVEANSLRMVRFLLSRGADVNAPGSESYGATALQRAAITGSLRIVVELLENGADVNAPASRKGGRTALEAAAEHGRLDVLSLLLQKDKEPGTLATRRQSAIKFAEEAGESVAVRILKEWDNASE